jgi:hypothetical protein
MRFFFNTASDLPGRCVAVVFDHDHAMLVIFERPSWQFWRPRYGVKRFEGEEVRG